MTKHKARILIAIDHAIEELRAWHTNAEGEHDYICPGCETCVTVIPELQRITDLLTMEKGGREK